MLPAVASAAASQFMQQQSQQSRKTGPTAAAGRLPYPQRQSSVGSLAVVTTEVRTNAPAAPGGAQAADCSNPSMLSTDAPMIDYGHHVTVTVTYHSQTLSARSHEQMSIDACGTLCTEGRSSRPQVPPLSVVAHAEARLPNGDFLSSGSLPDLRDLIASAAAGGDMTGVQDDVQVPLVLPTTAASPSTSHGLSSLILDELVLPESPSHELPCFDLLVQQQLLQFADVNPTISRAPTDVPALSAAAAIYSQPQLQQGTPIAVISDTSAPHMTPCFPYTLSGSALNDGSRPSTLTLAHAVAAATVPVMQLDMDTACQCAVITASCLSEVAIPARGAAAASGWFGGAYQPYETSSTRPVNDVAAARGYIIELGRTQLDLPQLLPHSVVFRPSAHQQLLQHWGHQAAAEGACSSILMHKNAFPDSLQAAHDMYASRDTVTAPGGSEALAQQQLLLSHDGFTGDNAQLVCNEIDVLQQPQPAFRVNAMQRVPDLPGVHSTEAAGAVCDDIPRCYAGHEVVRHARLITCKTYLRHLDITQAMADDLLPHYHMQFPVEVPHSPILATTGFRGEIPMTPLCQANSGCTVLQKKNISLIYTSGAKFGVQYEVVSCNTQKHLRLNKGWRTFTRVQGIQVGDTIVFERRGNTSSTLYVGVVKGDSSPLSHALGNSQQQQQQQQQQVPANAQEPPNKKRRYA